MEINRWRRIEEIFHEATSLPSDQRSQFLDHACSGDANIRKEVESLLVADTMESGVSGVIAELAQCVMSSDEEDSIGKRVGPYRITDVIGPKSTSQNRSIQPYI